MYLYYRARNVRPLKQQVNDMNIARLLQIDAWLFLVPLLALPGQVAAMGTMFL